MKKAIYRVGIKCEKHSGENTAYLGLAENAISAIEKALGIEPACSEDECKYYVSSLECLGEPDF